MNKKLSLNVWIEGTLIAALAMSLSFLPIQSLNASLDLSLGLVPLVLYSFRRGLVPALMAGFTWGLLTIVVGSAMRNFISVPQIIFEYPFAFTFGGMGGLLSNQLHRVIKMQSDYLDCCRWLHSCLLPLVLALLGWSICLACLRARQYESFFVFLYF